MKFNNEKKNGIKERRTESVLVVRLLVSLSLSVSLCVSIFCVRDSQYAHVHIALHQPSESKNGNEN